MAKTTAKPRVKQPTVAQLHKRLQPIFNHWVRLRDTWIDKDGKRVGKCISCGADQPYERLQAGHFVPESQKSVHKYNPRNVNGQDAYCNLYLRSNPRGYVLGLREKYGERALWLLLETKDDKTVYTREQLLDMINIYTRKVKEYEDGAKISA